MEKNSGMFFMNSRVVQFHLVPEVSLELSTRKERRLVQAKVHEPKVEQNE